jgi:4-amino-4-deoxy-L-arabinose transferase-like glycosyltransferase
MDESYMVSSGRVLGLGYFDHPPASWWLSWGAAWLAGSEAAVIVRLPFIALFALSTWLMFRLGCAVADARAGFWAAVALNLSPVFGVTSGTWVLPDGPLTCALLGAALCLVCATRRARGGYGPNENPPHKGGRDQHALHWDAPHRSAQQKQREDGHSQEQHVQGERWGWWAGAGICAGLALLSKYTAILTIGGTFLFLAWDGLSRRGALGTDRASRPWLLRPGPYIAGALAVLVFSPVILWNATHDWASFAFQGERASGLRFRPLGPLEVLGGGALFVLPWFWVAMMWVGWRALRGGPSAHRLLACLAAPPIIGFALVAAWSGHRVLFHWAAPGYLMLFPLLGQAIAERIDQPWVRRTLAGTTALVLLAVTVIGAQTRWDVLGPALATVMRKDPTAEGVDWTSLRADLTARSLLTPNTLVGLPNWRDGGKIARGLGPDVPVVVLNRDSRQFGVARPTSTVVGQDMLVLVAEHPEQTAAILAPLFARWERLPDSPVLLQGRELRRIAVFRAERLLRWPPDA